MFLIDRKLTKCVKTAILENGETLKSATKIKKYVIKQLIINLMH